MKALLYVLPLALLFGAPMLGDQPTLLFAISFIVGLAMTLLSMMASDGLKKCTTGGAKTVRFYLYFAAFLAVLALVMNWYVGARLAGMASRPAIVAQVSTMVPLLAGSIVGFLLLAILTMIRGKAA